MNKATNKLLFLWILIVNSSLFAAEEAPNIGWLAVLILIAVVSISVIVVFFLIEKKSN